MRKTYLSALLFASALAIAGCGGTETAEPAANEAADANEAAPAEEAADANATAEEGGAPAAAEAGAAQDFNIVNNTGRTVMTLNVSPNDSNEWGPDILGTATIPNGASGTVSFARGQEQCLWDLRATFDDGQTGDWRGVNLCETTTVTLTPS
jgi:hypothetical protein